MRWTKESWENDSIVQLSVIPNKGKTTIRFQQEKLINSAQRKEMYEYWSSILAQIDL